MDATTFDHDDPALQAAAGRLLNAFDATLGVPFTAGNRVEVLRNGREIFPVMLESIERAEHTVEFLTFVYWTGRIARRFAETLSDAARRGVCVRILLDAFGCKAMNDALVDQMRDAGADVRWFRPLARFKLWKNDHRTHRKVMICDGRVAFTGGVGIAEEWEGDARNPDEWRDTHLRITGPAVPGLRGAFIGNWIETGADIPDPDTDPAQIDRDAGDARVQVVRATASVQWSDVVTAMRLAIGNARQRLWITTAYFVPDPKTTDLLCDAAGRGVDVRVLVPGPHTDQRLCRLAGEDVYEPLLDAGVAIRVFQPTMIHAKVLTVDRALAITGSANFNHRSMQKDDEVCVVIVDRDTVATLDRHFEEDCERADDLDLSTWCRRGVWQRVKESATRLVRGEL